MERVHFADYVLTEDTEFLNNGYECAAWYQKIMVKAGRYPVYGELQESGDIEDFQPSCKLTGTITGSNFSSYYCGMPIGKSKYDEDKGQEGTMYTHAYAHAIAWALIKGKPTRYELLPEYEARRVPFVYQGEQKETAGIFKK